MTQNALTIDLEDWYQGLTSTSRQVERWSSYEDRVVESTEKLLDILAAAKVKATFFTLGYVADQFPSLIRGVADAGHEIALHGYYHRQVSRLTPDEFREEMIKGQKAVEKAGGKPVVGHRAPMFSINASSVWALDILSELGFLYDSSIFPTKNMLYGYPDAPRMPYFPLGDDTFVEFPMSTVDVPWGKVPVSGGFYMRVMPYPVYRKAVQKLNEQGRPLIFYLHPWELDPGHPRSPLRPDTFRERLTHYWGLGGVEAKLTRLLQDFPFTTMRSLYENQLAQVDP